LIGRSNEPNLVDVCIGERPVVRGGYDPEIHESLDEGGGNACPVGQLRGAARSHGARMICAAFLAERRRR
jgi:hypothetical protein